MYEYETGDFYDTIFEDGLSDEDFEIVEALGFLAITKELRKAIIEDVNFDGLLDEFRSYEAELTGEAKQLFNGVLLFILIGNSDAVIDTLSELIEVMDV